MDYWIQSKLGKKIEKQIKWEVPLEDKQLF